MSSSIVCGVCKKYHLVLKKNCKIRLWFPSNIIYIEYMLLFFSTLYDVGTIIRIKKSWIDTFYNLLFTILQTESDYKTIELSDSTTYYFYSWINNFTMTFYNVRTKLNNNILKCADIKCTYEIKP